MRRIELKQTEIKYLTLFLTILKHYIMKTLSNYQQAKQTLKMYTIEVKEDYPTDKPMLRQLINDYTDYLFRSFSLSDYQRNLLSNYACKLHPKN